jgi:serine/threonine-protein kinase
MASRRERGELIGGSYVLDHLLGSGGMGIVYAAFQRSLERVVAVKLLRPELLGSATARRRLHIEAVAGARIVHRNSVSVLDYGEDKGEPFLAMEHVAGASLVDMLEQHGALPVDVSVRLVRQVCAALEAAHASGVVHADVKSGNVLVELQRDGALVPRLIDWGIARFIDDHSEHAHDSIPGTPDYLPPEVMMGDLPTFAADTYAAGIMLYELIAGITPFTIRTRGTLQGSRDALVPLSARCPELAIPSALDALVARALTCEPSGRFRDAGALGQALDLLPTSQLTSTSHASTRPLFSTDATTSRYRRDG